MLRFLLMKLFCIVSLLAYSNQLLAISPMEFPSEFTASAKDAIPIHSRLYLDEATGLPQKRLDYMGYALVERHFYTYKPRVVEEMVDDGISERESSIDGIHGRKLRRFSCLGNAPGICSMLEEFDVEVASGRLTLVRRMFNIHNAKNVLVQQDVFSSTKDLIASWRYSYDENAQLVSSDDLTLAKKNNTSMAKNCLLRERPPEKIINTKLRRLAFEYPSHESERDGAPVLHDFVEISREPNLFETYEWQWAENDEERVERCRYAYNSYWRRCQTLSKPNPEYVTLRWDFIQRWWPNTDPIRDEWSEFISSLNSCFEVYDPYRRLKVKAYHLPEYGELIWEWDYRQNIAAIENVLDLAEEDGGYEDDVTYFQDELRLLKGRLLSHMAACESDLLALHAKVQALDPARFAVLDKYRNEYQNEWDAIVQEFVLQFWSAALENDPEDPTANRWMAMTLADQGDYALAALYFKAAIAGNSQSVRESKLQAELHYRSGFTSLQNNAYDEAIMALNQSLEFNPYLDDAYLYRAACYYELGQADKAISDYRSLQAIASCPSETVHTEYTDSFAMGLCEGVGAGLQQAVIDIVPSLYATVTGMGQFCWSMCEAKYRTEVANSLIDYFDYIRSLEMDVVKQQLLYTLHSLIEFWDETPPRERGLQIGNVIGHFGVDVLLPGTYIKCVKAFNKFQRIKKANLIATLHEISAESTTAKLLLDKSLYSQKFYADALNMKYPGSLIAGTGHVKSIDDLPRLIALYGGTRADWVKKTSGTFNVVDIFGKQVPPVYLNVKKAGYYNSIVSCHWYENLSTNKRYELKISLWSEYKGKK